VTGDIERLEYDKTLLLPNVLVLISTINPRLWIYDRNDKRTNRPYSFGVLLGLSRRDQDQDDLYASRKISCFIENNSTLAEDYFKVSDKKSRLTFGRRSVLSYSSLSMSPVTTTLVKE